MKLTHRQTAAMVSSNVLLYAAFSVGVAVAFAAIGVCAKLALEGWKFGWGLIA